MAKQTQGTGQFSGYGEDLDYVEIIKQLYDRIGSLEKSVGNIGAATRISSRRKWKKHKQASTLNHLTRAICVATIDPWKENRVRYYSPYLHDPKTPLLGLPFARPCSSMGGFDDCGLNWVPPAGSTLLIMFEGGNREAPFYLGTTWHRDRGPGGEDLIGPTKEFQDVSAGDRNGYFHGPGSNPNDGHQVLPPWNTENYNGLDIDDSKQFIEDTEEQRNITYPHIYGFKTPEKHMLKMVDGNAKCNRRWKRLELQSGCGNWMIFKDDHLHYGGQWTNPLCPAGETGGSSSSSINPCSDHDGDKPYFTDIHGKPKEGASQCEPNCEGDDPTQCSKILGGHSRTPGKEGCGAEFAGVIPDGTKYTGSQGGKNKSYKHWNECRAYTGPGTPQNNKCTLPQTGIQFLSISGHTMVMDDSVEEPRGKPEWQRSTKPFDFGCNDKYLGMFWQKSATGHSFAMTDVEEPSKVRGIQNFIKLKTGNGNKIEMNDHTVRTHSSDDGCQRCPPDCAGEKRGIWMQSTSNHQINMVDELNLQCGPCRCEGGIPQAKAAKAYVQIRSGYGLEMRFNDDFSQEETQSQWIQILHPQCVDPQTDEKCNACDDCKACRGPHILRFQGRPKGEPGIVFLRAGGHSIRQTHDMDIVIVGDLECNPSDKFTYVSKKFITATEDIHFRYSGELHIFFAEKQILLMAGRDCPPPPGKKCCGPCLYNVIVARCPVFCPLTGILHWTEKAMSERVFASAYHPCQVPCGGDCAAYSAAMAKCEGKGCVEDEGGSTTLPPEAQAPPGHAMEQPEGNNVDPNTGGTIGEIDPPGGGVPQI
jgi:hypothetical protein